MGSSCCFLSDYLSDVCAFFRESSDGVFSSGHLLELSCLVGPDLLRGTLGLFDDAKSRVLTFQAKHSRRKVVQVVNGKRNLVLLQSIEVVELDLIELLWLYLRFSVRQACATVFCIRD